MSEKKVEMKICPKCKVAKDENEFFKDKTRSRGISWRCKECQNRSNREWRAKNPIEVATRYKNRVKENPDRVRARKLKQYGLSLQDVAEMFVRQAGKCAICAGVMVKQCVDHCHKTGKVRGLLCHGCNIGLGGFKDSSEALLAAITYLDTP